MKNSIRGAVGETSVQCDYPNQVNNVLAFPGIFSGALDARATQITPQMKLAAAFTIADCVKNPDGEYIIPETPKSKYFYNQYQRP
tara:strand:- start:287 stop:541 length:255 start_codon:yes stop_codon:yes gene_type:complete